MNALIGDRFLKRFFGRQVQQHRAEPTHKALALPEDVAEKPAEQGCPPGKSPPKQDAMLENKQTGEINQIQNDHD